MSDNHETFLFSSKKGFNYVCIYLTNYLSINLFIKVTETGAEGSSITAMIESLRSLPPPPLHLGMKSYTFFN